MINPESLKDFYQVFLMAMIRMLTISAKITIISPYRHPFLALGAGSKQRCTAYLTKSTPLGLSTIATKFIPALS